MPPKQVIDDDILRLNLYLAQGELDKAKQLARRGLLTRVSEVSSALMSLSAVARRQRRFDEAARLIDAYAAVDALFGLDRSNGEMLRLMLALDQDDRAAALDALDRFIDARLSYTLDYRANPFFAGVQTSVPSPQEIAATQDVYKRQPIRCAIDPFARSLRVRTDLLLCYLKQFIRNRRKSQGFLCADLQV